MLHCERKQGTDEAGAVGLVLVVGLENVHKERLWVPRGGLPVPKQG